MIASAMMDLFGRLADSERDEIENQNSWLNSLLVDAYGKGSLLQRKLSTLRNQCARFMESYGDGPVFILRAPARINLMGEHVDYVSYLPTSSLTFGSREHEMMLLFRPAADGRVRGTSTLPGCNPLEFNLADTPAGSGVHDNGGEWTHYLYLRPTPPPDWGNYLRGAAFFARMKYGERVRRGFDFLVDSSIPSAGGASSSSALTVLAGAAIRQANRLPCDALDLARDSAKAEWFVGTRGGTMDHLTMCLARARHLVHIAYQKKEPELLPLPPMPFRLVAFYAHAADKSREVMLEYNERAAVARIFIPAIIEDWASSRPSLYQFWQAALTGAKEQSPAGLDRLGEALANLPETMILRDMKERYPSAFGACAEAFHALVRDRSDFRLKVRARAQHHLGEVRRVAEAVRVLRDIGGNDSPEDPESGTREDEGVARGSGRPLGPILEEGMRLLGALLNESHRSLRDLYDVSTPPVERLMEIILSDPGVYGGRLMGGGFGGNVLALIGTEGVPGLVGRVQEQFFCPAGRDGVSEGAVMISTPGEGMSPLDAEAAARRAVVRFNENWRCAGRTGEAMRIGIGRFQPKPPAPEIRAVILAAGKGERARRSGLTVPKPLAPVLGVAAVARVLQSLRAAFSMVYPPIVIVSPETEHGVREALAAEDVIFVLQPQALGTGDAILCAGDHLRNFSGRTLVVWGTQPVIRPETMRLTLDLAALFPEFDMVLPTTVMERPYAPLYRDAHGRVTLAHETHLEHMHVPEHGETNIGLFLPWNQIMLVELKRLRDEFWREGQNCYDRPRGELGFPNELIRALAVHAAGVMACPIADWREEKGIKNRTDLARCEQYLQELGDSF